MAGEIVKVNGLDDLLAKLREIPLKLRQRVLRNALSEGARLVRDAAKAKAPVLNPAAKAPYRTSGTLKKAIRVRTSKRDRRAGDVGVFVNVKPAQRGQRGAKSKTDPFYWKFQEFGWNPARRGESKRARRALNKSAAAKRVPGRRFLTDAAQKFPEALRRFETAVGKWFNKVNASGRVE